MFPRSYCCDREFVSTDLSTRTMPTMNERIKLGVSACLLGQNVRYDAGHCRDPFITGTLSQYVELVPVCPEVECGLPVPREAMRLVGSPQAPRLVTVYTKQDQTDRMHAWCSKKLNELEKLDLCGFIFKKGSPSSGMEKIKVYTEQGTVSTKGIGIFARAFMERFPLTPVEENERLYDPTIRENFIEAIFVLKRWRETLSPGPIRQRLIDFHTKHELLLLAHSPKRPGLLSKMVAGIGDCAPEDFRTNYQEVLLGVLRLKTTRPKHTNVLLHALGYLRTFLRPEEKRELLEIIEQYRQGLLPLTVLVTLFNHYVRTYDATYLQNQCYFRPHPTELLLRNHA